jgi:hypothetical protein
MKAILISAEGKTELRELEGVQRIIKLSDWDKETKGFNPKDYVHTCGVMGEYEVFHIYQEVTENGPKKLRIVSSEKPVDEPKRS